ncbi:MAG: hypothetical protein JW754_03395 [Candidatus Aenigmarchaeota archaeon]|nr:hypothetical protein [Candidatus Aenigmarchaeota archaeon]
MNKKNVMIAVFISLLFVSLMTVNVSAEGLLSDLFNKIKEWFESSPFGGLFSQPVKSMEMIDLTFYPEFFSGNAEDPVNITSETTKIYNFRGGMEIGNNGLTLKESGTGLSVEHTGDSFDINGLRISSLELSGMKLSMVSGNWNETSENGTVRISDFLGNFFYRNGSVELVGNVSKITKG